MTIDIRYCLYCVIAVLHIQGCATYVQDNIQMNPSSSNSNLIPSSSSLSESSSVHKRTEYICRGSIDLRPIDFVNSLSHITNCTVVEGYLQISNLPYNFTDQVNELKFPRLIEITDYLLVYKAFSLRSLGKMFPSLSVIGGQTLFKNYALIVDDCPNMIELGFKSLTRIKRGGIHIKGNANLCFANSIDWSYIVDEMLIDTYISGNLRESYCRTSYGGCPTECPSALLPIGEDNCQRRVNRPLCWNSRHCQTVCPGACRNSACYTSDATKELAGVGSVVQCCHDECLGGCSGPTERDCFACLHVFHDGACLNKCPQELYAFEERRCVTQSECRSMHKPSKDQYRYNLWMTTKNGTCVVSQKKVCDGITIDSVTSAAARDLIGCTVIKTPLEIWLEAHNTVAGAEQLEEELEAILGEVQEVTTYIRIMFSSRLRSLSFFKSLKVIRGQSLYMNSTALFVRDNENLEEIWELNDENRQEFQIQAGSVYFSGNKKLCEYKIREFAEYAGVENRIIMAESSNGDGASCEQMKLMLRVGLITSHSVQLQWDSNVTSESIDRYATVINYREVREGEKVTSWNAHEKICSDEVWRTVDAQLMFSDNGLVLSTLTDLQPYTHYVAYGYRYGLVNSTKNFVTYLVHFNTTYTVPSSVTRLMETSKSFDSVSVAWSPPVKPHGPVACYLFMWQAVPIRSEIYAQRNYCSNKIRRRSKTDLSRPIYATTSQPKVETTVEQKTDVDIEEEFFPISNEYYKDCPRQKCCDCADASKKESKNVVQDNHAEFTKISESTDAFLSSLSALSAAKDNGKQLIYSQSYDTNFDIEEYLGDSVIGYWKSEIIHNESQYTLKNLRPYAEYNIQIVACNEEYNGVVNLCSVPAMLSVKTAHNAAYDVIDDSNITAILSDRDSKNQTVVEFYWGQPNDVNGVILSYHLELKSAVNVQQRPLTFCISSHHLKSWNNRYSVEGLVPGQWIYSISAESLAGRGPWSGNKYFTIPEAEDADSIPLAAVFVLSFITVFCILLISSCSVMMVWKKRKTLVQTLNPHYNHMDDLYSFTYTPDGWEIPRSDVTLMKPIASGSFGMVHSGMLRVRCDGSQRIKVAIKTVNNDSREVNRIAFLKEASIMKNLNCKHVVKLYGIVSQSEPHLVIMELMTNGDLKKYLQLRRPDSPGRPGPAPTVSQTIQMAGEIADGMAYLASRKFVHRDLAARNCLISEDMVVKIGDFGLTRDIYSPELLHKCTTSLLPIRWMAPESLRDGVFTSQSDVWSYGVVLWEVATLAEQPYSGLSHQEVVNYIIDGNTMEAPTACADVISQLISDCWIMRPESRPTFEDVIERLSPHLNQRFRQEAYFYNRHEPTTCSTEVY